MAQDCVSALLGMIELMDHLLYDQVLAGICSVSEEELHRFLNTSMEVLTDLAIDSVFPKVSSNSC